MPVALPHTWRPFGTRMAGALFGGGLLVICAALWAALDAETRAAVRIFELVTLALMGLAIVACLHALMRCRVEATESGLVVVNGYRTHRLEWAQVVGVSLPPGAPWASLDLADGTSLGALAIQGSDGQRAKDAVRSLRELLAG